MLDKNLAGANEVEQRREERAAARRDRKRRGRGRAFYRLAYPGKDWLALTVGERQVWIEAVADAQNFENDVNPLAAAARLGKMLRFYDMSKASNHVLPEAAFLKLDNDRQELLFRLALNLRQPLVVDARPRVVATVELFQAMSDQQFEGFFETLVDHLGDLEDRHPEKNWAMSLSGANFKDNSPRWKTVWHAQG